MPSLPFQATFRQTWYRLRVRVPFDPCIKYDFDKLWSARFSPLNDDSCDLCFQGEGTGIRTTSFGNGLAWGESAYDYFITLNFFFFSLSHSLHGVLKCVIQFSLGFVGGGWRKKGRVWTDTVFLLWSFTARHWSEVFSGEQSPSAVRRCQRVFVLDERRSRVVQAVARDFVEGLFVQRRT